MRIRDVHKRKLNVNVGRGKDAAKYGYGKNEYTRRKCTVCGWTVDTKRDKRIRKLAITIVDDTDGNRVPERTKGQNCPLCGFAY